ncbi:hypothetical protein ABZP36_002643 [Zizania latifolia]
MILVAVVAELLEEYTAAVAHAMERLLSAVPPRIFPRRVRFLVLRSLPFVAPPPPHYAVLQAPRSAPGQCGRSVALAAADPRLRMEMRRLVDLEPPPLCAQRHRSPHLTSASLHPHDRHPGKEFKVLSPNFFSTGD